MTNKTVTMPLELAETILSELTSGEVSVGTGAKLRALLAAPAVERQEPVVIDLDAVDWETIQQAADESNWMPNEYMRNEWVADVCNFLKYGRADTSPPAPVSLEVTHDRAYRNGLMAGFNFGIIGNEKGYAEAIARYDAEIHAATLESPAPVAVVLPDDWQDQLFEEMERRFRLRKFDDDHMVVDDTQIGVEFAVAWVDACLDKVKEMNQ